MTAGPLTQFRLLFHKNVVVSVIRNPQGFVKEVFFPLAIALLFLWMRGYLDSMPMAGMAWPKAELRAWPPGLEPYQPDLPANATREWVLLYNNDGKTEIDDLVGATVDRLNDDAIMWYDYEEYMLDNALYAPVRAINVENTTEALEKIGMYAKAFLPFLRFKQTDRLEGWFRYIREAGEYRERTVSEKKAWVEKNIVGDFQGQMWDGCNRPKLAIQLFTAAKKLCLPGPASRAVNGVDDLEAAFGALVPRVDAFTKKSRSAHEKKIRNEALQTGVRLITENLEQSELLRSMRMGEYAPPEGRRRRSHDLAAACAAATPAVAAKVIHEKFTRVKIVPRGFASWKETDDFLLDESTPEKQKYLVRRLAVIQFHNTGDFGKDEYPKALSYSLRFPATQRNFQPGASARFREREEGDKLGRHWLTGLLRIPAQIMIPKGVGRGHQCSTDSPGYQYEGFAILQSTLDNVFINNTVTVGDTEQAFNWRRKFQRLPFGKWSADIFPTLMQVFAQLLFILGTMSLALSSIKNIVAEKECRIKEYMKIMGASSNMQWLAWTVYFALLSTIIALTVTLVMVSESAGQASFQFSWLVDDMPDKNENRVDFVTGVVKNMTKEDYYNSVMDNRTGVLANSDYGVVFISIWLNLMQIVWFNFLLSNFFATSSSAAAVAGMTHFFVSAFWGVLMQNYADVTYGVKVATAGFPGLALGHMWYTIVVLEGRVEGLTWESIHERQTVEDDFSMYEFWWITVGWIVLYYVLTWWYEQVFPGEFGVSKPWYFLLTKDYWSPRDNSTAGDMVEKKPLKNPDQFEAMPNDGDVTVSLRGLRKEFTTIDGLKVAVDSLDMDMCKGQITSLLGHNGAGKTTTMNMLTGMMEPTAGTAIVNGHDIRTNMESVRSSLGLCPQFDILFPTLTIHEHLTFFAIMKGVGHGVTPASERRKAVDRHVLSLVKTMRFGPYLDNYPTELSGGWKRRLSVCIALIGGSKTVFLDEPTSGMDPSTRRILWNILLKIKSSRTMILSTHFMDEADILGDRIAIMSDGVLEAIGSSTFLKNHFGAGYHVMFSAVSSFDRDTEEKILKLVQSQVRNASVERNIGQEMSVLLPFSAVSSFDKLFGRLDREKVALGISTYGIQLTSLDEVFLKCTEKAKASKLYVADAHTDNFVLQDSKTTGLGLAFQRTRACLKKNIIVAKRDQFAMIIAVIVSGLLAMAAVMNKNVANQESNPRMNRAVRMDTLEWAEGLSCKDQILPYWASHSFANDSRRSTVDTVMNSIAKPSWLSTACGVTTETDAAKSIENQSCPAGTVNTTECLGWNNEDACDPHAIYGGMPEIPGHPYGHYGGYISGYDTNFMNRFDEIKGSTFDRRYLQGIGFDTTTYGYGSHVMAAYHAMFHDTKNTIYMMFNGQHMHNVGYTVSLASTALLKFLLTSSGYSGDLDSARITTFNHPLRLNVTEESLLGQKSASGANMGIMYGSHFLFASCVVCALWCKYKVAEKATKAKHVQYLTGLNTFTYWVSFYLVDFVKCSIVAVPTCLLLVWYDDETFGIRDANSLAATDPNDLIHAWTYMLAYVLCLSWAMLPWMYMISLLFETTATAVICLILFVFYGGHIYFMIVTIWRMVDTNKVSEWPAKLDRFGFLTMPPYVFEDMIATHYANNESKYLCTQDESYSEMCADANITYVNDYWAYNETHGANDGFTGVGFHVQALLIQGVAYFTMLCCIESLGKRLSISSVVRIVTDQIQRISGSAKITIGGNGVVLANDDEDVKVERERCVALSDGNGTADDVLVAMDLRKVYDTRTGPLCAVDGLSFGIKKSSCFGLLGVNGAGKTTAFKMLTGDEDITSGDCRINGHSMVSQKGQAQQCVGYCPQFNALIDSLTGRETVEMYCDLRGLSRRDKIASCDELLRVLDITPHMNKECGIYSGGNKRKLSVALAMVGEPPLLFLDEPSTGMDPGARHALWDSIVKIQTRGTSVILTSHSMEECEALCSKLAIMVNGKFQCFGAVQHLRSKFGQGYTLEMEVAASTATESKTREVRKAVIDDVRKTFGDYELVLKEQNAATLVFDVPITKETKKVLELATLFSNMELLKKRHGLVGYSVRQRTLEEMFLNFTKSQRSDDRQQ